MISTVKKFIEDNNLIEKNSKVVVAFSYGVDSTVLLDVLIKLGYKPIIAHVNHKHRAQSEIEEAEAISLAKRLNIDIEILHLKEDKSKNFHDDAHHKRYEFFIEVAKKYNTKYIATAHHLNDNAETILLNLIRGSNLYGYSGISASLEVSSCKIIRPFLCVTKNDIINYQKENNLKYFYDQSNSENYFTRNRIRHHIIPLLEQENKMVLYSFKKYSNQVLEAFNYIRDNSISYLKKWDNKINIEEFKTLHLALKTDIISLMFEKFNLNKNTNLINDLLAVISNNQPQVDISLNNEFLFKKRYGVAFIEKKTSNEEICLSFSLNDVIYAKNIHFYFTKNKPSAGAKYIKLCYNKLVFPLTIRTRKNGDTIFMNYGHKKIKDLLMDLHLTREQKDNVILLLNNNEILWVCDYAKSKALIDMKDEADLYLVYEFD